MYNFCHDCKYKLVTKGKEFQKQKAYASLGNSYTKGVGYFYTTISIECRKTGMEMGTNTVTSLYLTMGSMESCAPRIEGCPDYVRG